MEKRIKRSILCAIICCILFGKMNVLAAGNLFIEIPQEKNNMFTTENDNYMAMSEPSLTECVVGVGIANNGLYITFDTTANQKADEIGVKNVIVQEKGLFGWKDIPASNYFTYNSDFYAGDIVYTGAQKGTTYRVKCTHYAKFGSTELTLNNTSSEIVYN